MNVPNTFVSQNPYYVVSNVKQIKPFLLLVSGGSAEQTEKTAVAKARGKLYEHDPGLAMKTTYNHVELQVVCFRVSCEG